MPSTRSQAGVDTPAGEAAEVAEALEEAAAELSAEIAARKAAEARVQALHAASSPSLPPAALFGEREGAVGDREEGHDTGHKASWCHAQEIRSGELRK